MKIPATYQTEVFINGNGYIAIAQTGIPVTADQLIELSRDQALLVARELVRLANYYGNGQNGDSVEGD